MVLSTSLLVACHAFDEFPERPDPPGQSIDDTGVDFAADSDDSPDIGDDAPDTDCGELVLPIESEASLASDFGGEFTISDAHDDMTLTGIEHDDHLDVFLAATSTEALVGRRLHYGNGVTRGEVFQISRMNDVPINDIALVQADQGQLGASVLRSSCGDPQNLVSPLMGKAPLDGVDGPLQLTEPSTPCESGNRTVMAGFTGVYNRFTGMAAAPPLRWTWVRQNVSIHSVLNPADVFDEDASSHHSAAARSLIAVEQDSAISTSGRLVFLAGRINTDVLFYWDSSQPDSPLVEFDLNVSSLIFDAVHLRAEVYVTVHRDDTNSATELRVYRNDGGRLVFSGNAVVLSAPDTAMMIDLAVFGGGLIVFELVVNSEGARFRFTPVDVSFGAGEPTLKVQDTVEIDQEERTAYRDTEAVAARDGCDLVVAAGLMTGGNVSRESRLTLQFFRWSSYFQNDLR